jgi:hypothetical protein
MRGIVIFAFVSVVSASLFSLNIGGDEHDDHVESQTFSGTGVCPTFVNRHIWTSGDDYGDSFGVTTSYADGQTTVTARRIDEDRCVTDKIIWDRLVCELVCC